MNAALQSKPFYPAWARPALDRLIQGKPSFLDTLWARPERLMEKAGLTPDHWQRQLLRSFSRRMLLLCSRQSGKSQVAAAIALQTALTMPGSLTLLLSPSERQSGELFTDKLLKLYDSIDRPVKATKLTALQLTLANGGRIVALPGAEGTIRGYSGVALLIVDEAARVPDALYFAIRPMLAVSRGRLVALSTPFGKRGWFYEAWEGSGPWERVRITAHQCPRLSAEFLAEEKRAMGERWYRQEYLCSFEDCVGAVFNYHDIMQAISPDVEPLFLE